MNFRAPTRRTFPAFTERGVGAVLTHCDGKHDRIRVQDKAIWCLARDDVFSVDEPTVPENLGRTSLLTPGMNLQRSYRHYHVIMSARKQSFSHRHPDLIKSKPVVNSLLIDRRAFR